jgi:hypothetical protein
MIGCPEILPFETKPLSARRHAALRNASPSPTSCSPYATPARGFLSSSARHSWLGERQASDVRTMKLEQIEREIAQQSTAAVGCLLHQLERRDAVGADAAKLSVDIGCRELALGKSDRGRRIFCRPVEPRPGEPLSLVLFDAPPSGNR